MGVQDNSTVVVTVDLSESTWKRLTQRKEPGDSFDDVVTGLLNDVEQTHETSDQTHTEPHQ